MIWYITMWEPSSLFMASRTSMVWFSHCLSSNATPESALLLSIISITINQHSSLWLLSSTTCHPAICLSCTSWKDWKAVFKNCCLVVYWKILSRPVTTSSQTLILTLQFIHRLNVQLGGWGRASRGVHVAGMTIIKTSHCSKPFLWLLAVVLLGI